MSLALARERIGREVGPVRSGPGDACLLVTREVFERLRRRLPRHRQFRECLPSRADSGDGVLFLGATVVLDPTPGPKARPAHWREIEWLESNPEVLERHRGQWVALDHRGIAAASQDAGELARTIRELGMRRPFILRIPSPDPGAQVT